tara:strand:- start:10184 stop:11068 length:885 start_codon:yes stop_codon:yes gene_type:complete
MNLNFSWVVATLGNQSELSSIIKTAYSLSSEYSLNVDLIFALPPDKYLKKKGIFSKEISNFNFRVINCPQKNQVRQRNYGISKTLYDLVVISDDDIIITPEALISLIKIKVLKGSKCVVGPSLLPLDKNQKIIYYPDILMLKLGIPVWLIKKFLNITKIGFGEATNLGIGCSFINISEDIFPVDWLPGALTVHTKSNLGDKNLYPWKGKAYGEDYFHSIIYRRNGINYFYVKEITYKCNLSTLNSQSLLKRFNDFYLTFKRIYKIQFTLYKQYFNFKLFIYFIFIIIYKLTTRD